MSVGLAHLDDHERQLALQQEEEALANAVSGMPSLGTGRDRLWPLSDPIAEKPQLRARCPNTPANQTAWGRFAWR